MMRNTPVDNPQPRFDEEAPDAKAESNDDAAAAAPESPEKVTPPSLSKLLSLARPEFAVLAFSVFLMVASECTYLYNPILIAEAYDNLVDFTLSSTDRMSAINRTMILVVILHGAGMLTGFIRSALMGIVGERVVARLRNQLYGAILIQEIAFFDEHKSGELVSRLGSDTTLVQQATSLAVPEVILGALKVVVCIGLMFWLSAPLAGVTLGFVTFIFLVCIPFGKALGKLSKSYQDNLGNAQNCSTEALGSMRTVQSFAAEERERKRYEDGIGDPDAYPLWIPEKSKRTSTTYGAGVLKSLVNSGFYTFLFGVGFGSMHVSLWYGFKLVNDGKMTLGDLTAFQAYIFQIGSGLGNTSRYLTQVIEAKGASGRIFQLLERVPAILSSVKDSKTTLRKNKESSLPLKGSIIFRDVSFSYPSRQDVPVLVNTNLTIPENTTAAFVGSSGAGKSTIVNLIQRFYDVSGGSITINGEDIRNYDVSWLRNSIGFVQQEPQLFGLTVKENVCYGMEGDVADEEVERVCREANAHEFISQWPQKYDTLVGERGVKLSGGQKQRIAIARALLVNPSILLLDEATSALDAESEHLVQDAIAKAVIGRTVLIVAHRLSTIKDADQIFVLDGQTISDHGSHDELITKSQKYQDLIKRQQSLKS